MTLEITLRPATLDDAAILRSWRNDLATRNASHSTYAVSLREHLVWLEGVLADDRRRLLIAEEAGVPVGSVRADLSEGVWELSWTVAPEARGRGVATRMVAQLAGEIKDPIRAEIKAGNPASIRIAEHAGMSFVREAGGVLHYARKAQQ